MHAEELMQEPVVGKWAKQFDWPNTRENRRLMQNYWTGRLRLVKANQVGAMTARISGKGRLRDCNAAPVWRAVTNGESDRLWRAEVYTSYFENVSIRARSEYNLHAYAVKVSGGAGLDPDLVDDVKLRKKATIARQSETLRDQAAERAKGYKAKHKAMELYLREIAAKHREDRDISELEKAEAVIYQQEELKARAQARVKAAAKKGT